MEIFLITLFVISLIFLVITYYIKIRINHVEEFLLSINMMCYLWCLKHHDQESAYVWFYDKYVQSYNHYLFSFKKLIPENWFPKEILDKLKNNKL